MKSSELLIKSKKYLKRRTDYSPQPSQKTHLICEAILLASMAEVDTTEVWAVRRKLVTHIQAATHPHNYVDAWLLYDHRELFYEIAEAGHMQKYRHAWVDRLIAEYKAKGD